MLCRVLFLLLVLAPTLGVAGLGLWSRLPQRLHQAEARLAQWFDLPAEIGSVEYPRPGLVRYRDVRLFEPETGRPLITIPRVQLRRASTGKSAADQSENGTGNGGASEHETNEAGSRDNAPDASAWTVKLSEPVLESEVLPLAWHWLESALEGRQRLGTVKIHLVVEGHLTVAPGALPEQRFHNAAALLDISPKQARGQLQFRHESQPTGQPPATLAVVRTRPAADHPQGMTTVRWDTAQATVPCRIMNGLGETQTWLGDDCQFQGAIWATRQAGPWSVQATGWLLNVDLERMVSEHFDHQLEGRARVMLRRLQWEQGQIAEINGAVLCEGGRVSRSLLESWGRGLNSPWGVPRDATEAMLPFEQLAVSFALDRRGLVLEGHCRNAPPGTLLADRVGQLLGQPRGPRPVGGLLHALSAEGGATTLPLDQPAARLARILPLGQPAARNPTPR
jgi:hypothetical protein